MQACCFASVTFLCKSKTDLWRLCTKKKLKNKPKEQWNSVFIFKKLRPVWDIRKLQTAKRFSKQCSRCEESLLKTWDCYQLALGGLPNQRTQSWSSLLLPDWCSLHLRLRFSLMLQRKGEACSMKVITPPRLPRQRYRHGPCSHCC